MMSITIRIEKALEPWWGTDEELATLDDTQLIDLLQEDLLAVIEDATWEVIRTDAAADGSGGADA